MEQKGAVRIDTFTLPLPARRSPYKVKICCPPSNSTVGVNFKAIGTVDGRETHRVTSVTINGQSADSISNVGNNWSAPFTGVKPGPNKTLTAVGDDGSPDSHINITVSNTPPPQNCACVDFDIAAGGYGGKEKELVRSIEFTGGPPLNRDRKPVPLALSTSGPADFLVGGSVTPPARVTEVTLGGKHAHFTTEGPRWSVSLSDVPHGEYTIQVTADDGSTDSMQLTVSDLKP
jgi:hypothetical protein